MFSELAIRMGIDAGILALAIFCFFWILLGLGGAILLLSMKWPFHRNSPRSQEKDPGLAQDQSMHPRH